MNLVASNICKPTEVGLPSPTKLTVAFEAGTILRYTLVAIYLECTLETTMTGQPQKKSPTF